MPHEKVNVNGGAIALGHPLGATGRDAARHAARRARAPQAASAAWSRCASAAAWASRPSSSGSEVATPMNTIRYDLDADGIATITFDAPDSPVNTMTAAVAGRPGRGGRAARPRQGAHQGRAARLGQDDLLRRRGAEGRDDAAAEPTRPPASREIEAMKASFRTIETLGRPVVALLNGAALGGGWEVALIGHARFALDDPKIQFGMPEVTLGPDPRRDRHHQDGAPARPDGRAALPARRQAVRPARGARARPGRGPGGRRRRTCAPRRSPGSPRIPTPQQPWDDKDYRMPGGTPASPKIAGRPRGRAGDAAAEDARPLSGGRGDPRDHGRRRAGRLRHRHRASRAASSPRSWSSQTAKNMITGVLLQPERDQVRQVAAGGLAALEAAQGRRARRRHDGRGHRPCQRGARHRRAC